MQPRTCPTKDHLSKFARGALSAPASSEVESHLLECDSCCLQAESLQPFDSIESAVANPLIFQEDAATCVESIIDAVSQRYGLPDESIAVGGDSTQPSLSGQQESDEGADLSGEVLGDYRLAEILGRGGMGVVYRAEDQLLGREVAVKVIRHSASKKAEVKERFLREARATGRIDHENVVTVHQVGEDKGVVFIAMPLLRGESLAAKLKREQRLPESEVLEIGRQVAAGLSAAFEHRLTHRDVKPDNIWLSRDGKVKLLDFGLVADNDESTNLTHSGTIVGTPRYMSPEQAAGDAVDHRSDLFSLGCVLYHCATGSPPFDGKNLTAILLALSKSNPASPRDLEPTLSRRTSNLILGLLKPQPRERVQTANELIEKINAIVAGRATGVSPSRLWTLGAAFSLAITLLATIAAVLRPRDRPVAHAARGSVRTEVTARRESGDREHAERKLNHATKQQNALTASDSSALSLDQQFASRLFSKGVHVLDVSAPRRPLDSLAQIQSEHFQLLGFRFTNTAALTAEDLRGISDLPGFRRAEVWREAARSPILLEALQDVTTLRSVAVHETQLNDGLVDWITRQTNIEGLILSSTRGQQDYSFLLNLPSVLVLDIPHGGFGDGDVEFLQNMEQLRYLNLDSTGVTDACLEHLSQFEQLHTIALVDTAVSQEALVEFTKQRKWTLAIFKKNGTRFGVQNGICGWMHMAGNWVSERVRQTLPAMHYFPGASPGRPMQLKSHIDVDREVAKRVRSKGASIRTNSSMIGPADSLPSTVFSVRSVLFPREHSISAGDLADLDQLQSLVSVAFQAGSLNPDLDDALSDVTCVSEVQVYPNSLSKKFIEFLHRQERLQAIHFRQFEWLEPEQLRQLPAVERLELGDSNLTDSTLAHLRQLEGLEKLDLRATQLTDSALDSLSEIASLRHVILYDTDVSEPAIFSFSRRRPGITVSFHQQGKPVTIRDGERLDPAGAGWSSHRLDPEKHLSLDQRLAYGLVPLGAQVGVGQRIISDVASIPTGAFSIDRIIVETRHKIRSIDLKEVHKLSRPDHDGVPSQDNLIGSLGGPGGRYLF